MDNNNEQNNIVVPPDVDKEARIAAFSLLPLKSLEKYKREFELFDIWRKERSVQGINENILLAYFNHISKTYKAPTLWSKYSMLKATININENVNIGRFKTLTQYLSQNSRNHQPKESKIFEKKEIEQFFTEAPDNKYLMLKMVLLFGVFGACHCDELTYLSIDDIKDKESYLYVILPNRKKKKPRSFIIKNEGFSVDFLKLYRAYIKLRPNVPHRRFFLSYKGGKCTVQPVGINTFSKIPRQIATYLKLSKLESYTGHCFRRTAAKLGVNREVNFIRFNDHNSNEEESMEISNNVDVDLSPTSVDTEESNQVVQVKTEVCDQIIQKRCDICLKHNHCVFSVNVMDKNNIKLITKLQTCIPEVEWQLDYQICLECSKQVESSYNFRQLCINSLLSKKNLEAPMIEDRPIKTEIDIEETRLLEVSTESKFLCSYCQRCFHLERNLTHHLLVAHSDDSVSVNRMDTVPKIRKESGRIELNDNNTTAHKCHLCDASFTKRFLLNRHLTNDHSGATVSKRLKLSNDTMICQHCNQAFGRLIDLDEHVRIKHSENLVVRKVGNIEQRTESLLSVNVKVECDSCGLRLQNQNLLIEHIEREHSTEKNFKCSLCHQKFAALSSLKVHKCYFNTDGQNVFGHATVSK